MNDYLVIPEKGRFYEVKATTFEMAYAGICYWYNPKRRIATKTKASITANKPKEFNETANGYKKIVSISKTKNKIA